MIAVLSSRRSLSKEVVEGVSERTGGVPLFVEEVTRLLLERGVEVGVQSIPLTLQQSLAARLDRTPPRAGGGADQLGARARLELTRYCAASPTPGLASSDYPAPLIPARFATPASATPARPASTTRG